MFNSLNSLDYFKQELWSLKECKITSCSKLLKVLDSAPEVLFWGHKTAKKNIKSDTWRIVFYFLDAWNICLLPQTELCTLCFRTTPFKEKSVNKTLLGNFKHNFAICCPITSLLLLSTQWIHWARVYWQATRSLAISFV